VRLRTQLLQLPGAFITGVKTPSSRPGKQLQHTMENPTGSICDTDYKSLVNQCLEICSALKDKGCKFSLSLRLGSSFNFSLSSEGCSPEATKKTRRSPSYLRRQTRRRAAFLERKKKLPLADVVTPTTHNNQVCRQGGATLLDKKTTSSWQMDASEVETVVDKDCSLDLNPNPTLPRGSDGSMESDDSREETKIEFEIAPGCNWEDVESEAEQKFCEFRMRWIGRLDKCTDDWALKTKLLESLEDAYLAPVTVLTNGDFDDVKDKFFHGDLSPARFLDELQRLLSRN